MEKIILAISGWIVAFLNWTLNRKEDENASLKAEQTTLLIEHDLKPEEEQYEKIKKTTDNKVLDFKSVFEQYRNDKNNMQ